MSQETTLAGSIVRASTSAAKVAFDLGLKEPRQIGPILALHLMSALKKQGFALVVTGTRPDKT